MHVCSPFPPSVFFLMDIKPYIVCCLFCKVLLDVAVMFVGGVTLEPLWGGEEFLVSRRINSLSSVALCNSFLHVIFLVNAGQESV